MRPDSSIYIKAFYTLITVKVWLTLALFLYQIVLILSHPLSTKNKQLPHLPYVNDSKCLHGAREGGATAKGQILRSLRSYMPSWLVAYVHESISVCLELLKTQFFV